jgi:hypothetical protein
MSKPRWRFHVVATAAPIAGAAADELTELQVLISSIPAPIVLINREPRRPAPFAVCS